MIAPRSIRPLFCLSASWLVACGGPDQPNPVQVAFVQRPPPGVVDMPLAFRFPKEPRQPVRLYHLPDVEELSWRFDDRDLATKRIIGYSPDEDMIFFQSPDSILRSLELASGRVRTLDTLTQMTTIGPTSTLFIIRTDTATGRISMGQIVDRRLDIWPDSLPSMPERIWGTTDNRMVAVMRDANGRFMTHFADPPDRDRIDIPEGPLAVTAWGDFVAVVAGQQIIGIRLSTPGQRMTIEAPAPVTAVAFSASAHRLYYMVEDSVYAINRFDFEPILRFALASPLAELRPGEFGRYLLGRPENGDSVVVLDAANGTRLASVAGTWADGLPTTTEDGFVLVRQDDDLVALNPATGVEAGRLKGARGVWVVIPWDPRRPTLQLVAETAAAGDEEVGNRVFYAQLGSTSNLGFATDRVQSLVLAGLPARVALPSEFDDRYRIVLGPYPTRGDADDNARRLGQAYFIISYDRGDTTVAFSR